MEVEAAVSRVSVLWQAPFPLKDQPVVGGNPIVAYRGSLAWKTSPARRSDGSAVARRFSSLAVSGR